jgi:DNA-binding XRE family transcriptional regulator
MEHAIPKDCGISPEVELFRRGRRAMGWTQEILAETVLVSVETLQHWEDGELPIPPKVMAWVALYAHSCPIDDTSASSAPVVQYDHAA